MLPATEPVVIGRIERPHGVAGAVRARATGPTLGALADGARVELAPREGPPRRIAVVERSGSPERPVLRLEGVATRDEAARLAGAWIRVEASRLPAAPDPDTWYVLELIGVSVWAEGVEVGRVVDVMDRPANDVLVVAGAGGEALVPFTADAVVTVDRAAGRLEVRPRALVT